MRRLFLTTVGLITALSLSAGSALAFQELPVPPPPSPSGDNAPQAKPPTLQLATPKASAGQQAGDKGGLNVFGYHILPKLNFGLELLYGEDQQQQLDLKAPSAILNDNSDVTVLGKVKRRF
jgi:hypothetical protein